MIGELHEIAEILDRGVAPALVEHADERRPIDRREDRVVAADDNIALAIAGKLGEFLRRGFDQGPHQTFRKTHALALDVGAGTFPHGERFSIVAKIDADLLEHGFTISFDERQSLFAEHFVKWNIAPDISELCLLASRACSTARLGAASPAA